VAAAVVVVLAAGIAPAVVVIVGIAAAAVIVDYVVLAGGLHRWWRGHVGGRCIADPHWGCDSNPAADYYFFGSVKGQ
jgi:hypothetical protein